MKKMYGLKINSHHLNSRGVWTEIQLPNANGDWMIFSAREAQKAIKKGFYKPNTNEPMIMVELS